MHVSYSARTRGGAMDGLFLLLLIGVAIAGKTCAPESSGDIG